MQRLFMVFLVSSITFANTRLEYKQIPMNPQFKIELTRISILGDGLVVLSRQSPVEKLPSTKLSELDEYEMNVIEDLITEARSGKIMQELPQVRCVVAPLRTSLFTADNGKVFLLSGDICSGFTKNGSPAAAELVGILKKYLEQSFHVMGEPTSHDTQKIVRYLSAHH